MISVATVRSGSRDRSLHSCQPDSGQGCRDLLRIELLIFLPAEKLLNQKVIDNHAEEPASCHLLPFHEKTESRGAGPGVYGRPFTTPVTSAR